MKWKHLEPPPECYSCREPYPPNAEDFTEAIVCVECFHFWSTPAALITADYEQRFAMARDFGDPDAEKLGPRLVENIVSCPCCAHDF